MGLTIGAKLGSRGKGVEIRGRGLKCTKGGWGKQKRGIGKREYDGSYDS